MNAQYERWEGEETVENREGRRVVEWMDNEGFRLGTPSGILTRKDNRVCGGGGVIDIRVWTEGLEVTGRVWEGVVGIDHRPIEMEVKIIGMVVEKDEQERGSVDWERVETMWRIKDDWEKWWGEMDGSRKRLDEVVRELEDYARETVEECKRRRNWKDGKKRW
ncbi:hypothetical protein HOY82DRAFT_536790 [Tuber indicum]|nr:hypothetical protein HOY82DRAFT_536790 [Tuber indicum]